jgi:hypothetical protein
MPDPYWDDVAKKSAEDLARGRGAGQRQVWFPTGVPGPACPGCGEHPDRRGYCSCHRPSRGSVNGPTAWRR